MVSFRFTIARALLTAMATPASSEQPPRMVGDITVSPRGRAERLPERAWLGRAWPGGGPPGRRSRASPTV